MPGGIEEFNEERNLNRVTAGWQDGPQYKNPNLVPSMEVVDATPPTVAQKLQVGAIAQPPIMDPWVSRRNNAKL